MQRACTPSASKALRSYPLVGSMLALTGLGLIASFLHLGHPERAWRTAHFLYYRSIA